MKKLLSENDLLSKKHAGVHELVYPVKDVRVFIPLVSMRPDKIETMLGCSENLPGGAVQVHDESACFCVHYLANAVQDHFCVLSSPIADLLNEPGSTDRAEPEWVRMFHDGLSHEGRAFPKNSTKLLKELTEKSFRVMIPFSLNKLILLCSAWLN